MAYWNISSGNASYSVPVFKGLLQYGDDLNATPVYAMDAKNMSTTGGVMQPVAEPKLMPYNIESPFKTLAVLYRRWGEYRGMRTTLYGMAGGDIYVMPLDCSYAIKLNPPAGISKFQSDEWSCVAYEINYDITAPTDVLLISNAYDGMFMIDGDTITKINTPKKYGIIERHAERIWGTAILEDPDMLQYSAPFDPTDWMSDPDVPEDGAGDIQQPSWDGDSFTALKTFGSQLIAFKKNRVWRILGTDPGEYVFKEQYGGGAPYAWTVVVDTERIFALTDFGPVTYDGVSVAPYQQEAVKKVFDRVNREAMQQACACKWREDYYCAIPIDGSKVNNAVLIYNSTDNTWLLRTDMHVESWLATEAGLYFTSSTTPGRIWTYEPDAWESGHASSRGSMWQSPWCDLSGRRYTKSSFTVYVTVEQQEQPAELQMTIETEREAKTRTITPRVRNGKAIQRTLHFNVTGTRFRWKLEAPVNTPVWRILGGILIVMDVSAD